MGAWIVIVDDHTQRTCPHTPVTLIERAIWDEMICSACAAVIFNLAAFDHDDTAELCRVAAEDGLDFHLRDDDAPETL